MTLLELIKGANTAVVRVPVSLSRAGHKDVDDRRTNKVLPWTSGRRLKRRKRAKSAQQSYTNLGRGTGYLGPATEMADSLINAGMREALPSSEHWTGTLVDSMRKARQQPRASGAATGPGSVAVGSGGPMQTTVLGPLPGVRMENLKGNMPPTRLAPGQRGTGGSLVRGNMGGALDAYDAKQRNVVGTGGGLRQLGSTALDAGMVATGGAAKPIAYAVGAGAINPKGAPGFFDKLTAPALAPGYMADIRRNMRAAAPNVTQRHYNTIWGGEDPAARMWGWMFR